MKGRFRVFAAITCWISATACAASSQPALHKEVQPPPRHAIVLVHGYKNDSSTMQSMANYLRQKGFTVYTPTLSPSVGQVGLDELARQLSIFVDAHIHHGEKFDLVGFSMGGLVCRYYLQRMGGLDRVDRFITLGAPNHGTVWACLSNNPGCRQMRPGSDFLNDLNSDIGTLGKIEFTSVWTPLDLMIVPANSSRTAVGRNLTIWIPIHPFLVWSPLSGRTVAGLLKS